MLAIVVCASGGVLLSRAFGVGVKERLAWVGVLESGFVGYVVVHCGELGSMQGVSFNEKERN